MSEQPELALRVKDLEKLVKKQADQIEGLKQSINILIGMVASNLDTEEEHSSPMGPQMPEGIQGLGLNN